MDVRSLRDIKSIYDLPSLSNIVNESLAYFEMGHRNDTFTVVASIVNFCT